jgi:hypothetical protein
MAIVIHDCFADASPQRGHTFGQPWRHTSAMQRQIGSAGTVHDLILMQTKEKRKQSCRDFA